MIQREPGAMDCDPSALPAQGGQSGHDPFSVEPDRFLEALMKAVDEEGMSKETSVVDPSSQAPSALDERRASAPTRSERVRYSFD